MIKNGIYNLIGTAARLILSILSVPLLIKFIGTASYGLYAILFAVINFAALTEWSVSVILTVFLPRELASSYTGVPKTQTLKVTLLLILCLSTFTTLALWIAAPYATLLFNNLNALEQDVLKKGIQLAGFVVFTRLLQQYFIGIEQAHGKYKLVNSINTLYNLVQTIALLVVAWLYKSILPIVAVQAFVSLLFVFYHAVICHRMRLLVTFYWQGRINWKEFKSISTYGFRTYMGALGTAFFSQGDRIIVGKLLGLEASGIYSALIGVVTQIHTLATVPAQPIMPTISALLTNNNLTEDNQELKKTLSSVIHNALLMNVTVSVSLGCCSVLMAPEIINFIFNGVHIKVINAIEALRIVACIYSLYALNAVGYYILFAIKKEIITIVTSLVCGLFTLFLIYTLSKGFGLIGAIIGNTSYVLTLYMLYKGIVSIGLSWKLIYRTIAIPILILFLSVVVASNFNDFFLRLLFVILTLTLLSLPTFRQNTKTIKNILRFNP